LHLEAVTEGKERKSVGDGARLPAHEVFRLLAVATGRPLAEVRGGVDLTLEQRDRFVSLVNRRLGGEPLQYLEGWIPFAGIELAVDRRALIPRPETEYLVELAAASAGDPSIIVDLCCGSGALALALKRRFSFARVLGTDISTAALELAQANATRNQLDVEWKAGYLFEAVPDEVRGKIELLVANPPYVANSDWDNLPVDVRWEPRIALLAGDRGTEVIEAILDDLAGWMSPGGIAWIEVGDGQATELTGSDPVTAIEDQYGAPRYLRLEVGSAGT
jgi:release factor-specific protein-(glutamine-N5) methyltransferase